MDMQGSRLAAAVCMKVSPRTTGWKSRDAPSQELIGEATRIGGTTRNDVIDRN
jgi:hypothetical protein